ncbi:MAG: hypothetical protein QOG21_2292 [Actinomycetota bacterium]|jgi:hypothetical protein|nr:hypothetical protein [Actinomycetota bacterium]
MRLRATIGIVAFVAALLPVAPSASPACAAEAPHAALVVDTAKKVLRYCVMLDQPSVSGLRLIELAHDQYGLSYRSDGAAVCMLAGTGTTDGDCFGDYPDFWGYWRGNGSGGWTWAASGAATTSVHDGQVEGWSWGTGDSGASHPRPPNTTFSSVCQPARPTASPGPRPSSTPRSQPTPRTRPKAAPSAATSRPRKSPDPKPSATGKHNRSRHSPQPARARPTARSSPIAGVAASKPDDGSIPGAGIAALLVAAALSAAGWLLVRRRHLSA